MVPAIGAECGCGVYQVCCSVRLCQPRQDCHIRRSNKAVAEDCYKWVEKRCMNLVDYSSRSLMQLCKTRHPLCSIPRGYLIASALLP